MCARPGEVGALITRACIARSPAGGIGGFRPLNVGGSTVRGRRCTGNGRGIERDVVNARGRRPRLIVRLALGLIVAAAVWAVGIVGMGQYGEDICLGDPPDEAAGYQSEGSVWPPRLTCVYGTREGGTLQVDYRLYAMIAAVWLVGFPLVATAGIGMVSVRTARSSRP